MLKLEYDKKEIEEVIDKIVKKNHEHGSDLGLALRSGILRNQ